MKTNKLRKFISGLTASLMCTCSINIPAYAYDVMSRVDSDMLTDTDISLAMQTSIPRMLWTVENMPEYLGIEAVENAVIGDYFTIADVKNGTMVEDNSIVYYPISSNGYLVAILSLFKCEGEVTATVGVDFSDKLEKALAASGNITLVSINDANIVAVDDNGSFEVISTDGTTSNEAISSTITKAYTRNSGAADRFTLTSNEVFDLVMPIDDVIGLYSERVENLRKDYYTTNSTLSTDIIARGKIKFGTTNSISILPDNLLYSYDSYATALGDYLDTYEIVSQGSLPICWAATIASMLRWELPSVYAGYTGIDVCDELGHSYTEAYVSDVDDYLTTFLSPYNSNYVPTYQNYAYTEATIKAIINNEDPVYMSASKPAGGSGHATALCGYLNYSDGTFAIRIMNPGTGSFQLSDSSYSSSTFRYSYNGTYYTWDSSVRFYYHHS